MAAEKIDMADLDQPIMLALADLTADCVRGSDDIEKFLEEEGLSLEALRKTAEGYGMVSKFLGEDVSPEQMAATGFFCGFELALRFVRSQRESGE